MRGDHASTVSLPVTPHSSGEYRYYLELRDGGERFTVRLPGGQRRYRVDVTAEPGPVVVAGSGNQDAVYGERIPVAITIAEPASIRSVALRHRTRKTMIARPLGSKVTVEYYILVRDAAGRVTHYGGPDKPYRLRIQAPQHPVDVGQ